MARMSQDMDRFANDYLHALDTFEVLRRQLIEVGAGGFREVDELGKKLLAHGAETYRDAASSGGLNDDTE